MAYAALEFSGLPRIGFAHHFRMKNYEQKHKRYENSLELVYVKEGAVNACVCGQTLELVPGSVAVIFRCEPFSIASADGGLHRHCTVQLQFDYRLTVLPDSTPPPEGFGGLLLPLVLPPCAETETIKKELYAIVSEIGISRRERELSAAAAALGILARLDQMQRQQTVAGNTASIWEYRIKQYIAQHIHKEITLEALAAALKKTPNYLNSVFRSATGTSIHRYINSEKVQLIAEMMAGREMSFKAACDSVGIADVSYGYRLFKKHMGVTMRAYLSGEQKTKEAKT